MNIIMAVIGLVGLERAPECIKMHHFEGENAKIRHSTPTPDHISGYGPVRYKPPAIGHAIYRSETTFATSLLSLLVSS